MMTAPIGSNLFARFLQVAIFCTIGICLAGPVGARAEGQDESAARYCVSLQASTAQQHTQSAALSPAFSEFLFLPIMVSSSGVQPAADGGARLAESPRIDRFVETLPDGKSCITFSLLNNTGREIRRLALEHVLSEEAGSAQALAASTDAPAILEHETDTSPGQAACRFAIAPGAAIAPGKIVHMSCQYNEGSNAILTSKTVIRPRPFDGYDNDYDRIGDSLAQKIADANRSGADQLLPLLILFDRPPNSEDYARFEQAGGLLTFRSAQLTIFGGEMPASAIPAYAADVAGHLELIGDDLALQAPPFTTDIVSRDTADATVPQVGDEGPVDDSGYLSIGVLDTGLDGTHAGLGGKIIAWHDVAAQGNREIIDPVGHGTHVAGIIAGELGDFSGVAVDTPLVGIRHGEEDNWRVQHFVQAIDWAIDNRRQLNLAVLVNSNVYTDPAISRNPFWNAAAAQAVEAGIIFVNAAGDGFGNRLQGEAIGSPATDPKVLTVGAVNNSNQVAFFSSRGTAIAPDNASIKPDVLATGSNVRSLRSNQATVVEEDGFALRSGTSTAAPAVAAEAALLAGLLYDATSGDEDADDLSGEDPWDGRDNDRDGLIDEDAGPWDFSEDGARTVKSLILMTAAEVGGGELVPDEHPNAGAVNDPRDRGGESADGWDRGGKDPVEGYGSVDIRAALDAVSQEFCAYGAGALGPHPSQRRVWARHLHLQAGKEYALTLDGPEDADYDLYLYQGISDPYGDPQIALRPEATGTPIVGITPGSADESFSFNVRTDGLYYLVVRRVEGEGDFTVHLTTPTRWTIMLYMPAERAGDAHMDADAFRLLNELERVGSGQEEMREVQVLAFIDYDARNPQDDNRLHATAGINGDAQVYCVRKDHRSGVSQYSVPVQPSTLVSTTVNADGVTGAEANLGAPETLQAFADFAIDHFPADRYGLILWGSDAGYGWKSNPDLAIGPGGDTRHTPDALLDSQADALDLAELGRALAEIKTKINRGSAFLPGAEREGNIDLLGFDMGQMAQVEVATQVQPSVDVMIAPETNLTAPWPYAAMLQALRCQAEGAGWNCDNVAAVTAEDLARTVVERFAEVGAEDGPAVVLSAMRLDGGAGSDTPCATFAAMIGCLDALANGLATGVDKAAPDNENRTNTQVLLAEGVRRAVAELHDRNAVDLRDLVGLLASSDIDSRYRPGDQDLADALTDGGPILFAVGKQGAADNLHGLAIYFPEARLQPDGPCVANPGKDPFACGYANPLPSNRLYAADEGITLPILAQEQHPRPALENLRFAAETGWGAFLTRYYRPTAQACLLAGDECVRRLSLQVGDEVLLSGAGSSDIDGAADDHAVHAWYWDVDHRRDNAADLPDYTPRDGPVDTPCSEDCDRDRDDEKDDDPDLTGPTATWTCPAYGAYQIRLIVHDDHHLQPAQHGESAHNRHWQVDDDTLNIFCYESPYQKLAPSPIVSTRPFTYTLIARGNGSLSEATAASLSTAMPAFVAIDPTSFDCSGNGCSLDSQTNTVAWSGNLNADQEVQMSFAATVRSEAIPEDAPHLSGEASIFDGVGAEQLAITAPIIVKRAEPITVTPGSVITFTTIIPANPALSEPATADLYDFFKDGSLAQYLSYAGAVEFPDERQPPKDDLISSQISWTGTIGPAEVLVIRYAVRLSESLPPDFCDSELETNGQVYDGVDISNNVNTSVRIVCPDVIR